MMRIRFEVCMVVADDKAQAAKRDTLLALEKVAETNGGGLEEVVEKGGADLFGPLPRPVTGERQAPGDVHEVAVDAAANREIFDWEDLPEN